MDPVNVGLPAKFEVALPVGETMWVL